MNDDNGAMSLKSGGYGDYSCASSVTDEDLCSSKAPGVVARLMGLESMPISGFPDASCTPYFDGRDASQNQKHAGYFQDHQMMLPRAFLTKECFQSRSLVEMKSEKQVGRPIEKFQTEVLPPKSAKSIPVTHHKLLSPIKSPGFVPSNSAAHIMEVAARIIEGSPYPISKARFGSVGSSPVPLNVRNFKEKLGGNQLMSQQDCKIADAKSQKDSDVYRICKIGETNRRVNGSSDGEISFKNGLKVDRGVRNGGNSISLAVQAKANVQKRESNALESSSRGMMDQSKILYELPSQVSKSQPNANKNSTKKHANSSFSGVLKSNGFKQNSLLDKEKSSSKSSVSNSGRKSISNTAPRQKVTSKVVVNKNGSRKMSLETIDSEKGVSPYSIRNSPRKKRLIDDSKQRSSGGGSAHDRFFDWEEESKREGIDVVSFTFTTPLSRTVSDTEPAPSTRGNAGFSYARNKKSLLDAECVNSSGNGPDGLSKLLEKKLKELSKTVASEHSSSGKPGAKSIIQESNNGSEELDSRYTNGHGLKHGYSSPILSSIEKSEFWWKPTNQTIDEAITNQRRPSPVSTLENPFSTASNSSLETASSNCIDGSKLHSSLQSHDLPTLSWRKCRNGAADIDLSDSASSIPKSKASSSTSWELDYISRMLSNMDSRFLDFASGRTSRIVSPLLFEQLEGRKSLRNSTQGRTERKALFEFVVESIERRCGKFINGGFRAWDAGMAMLRRSGLAREVYREMVACRAMWNCMVDELVDRDMSLLQGRWLDFDANAFAVADEIGCHVIESIVAELFS